MSSDIGQPTFISLLALGYALHALEEGDFCWRAVKNNPLEPSTQGWIIFLIIVRFPLFSTE